MDSRSSEPNSLNGALVVLPNDGGDTSEEPHLYLPAPSSSSSAWRPILSDSSQVVLYNPTSHALSVRPHSSHAPVPPGACPFCHRPIDLADGPSAPFLDTSPRHSRAANYFHLLEIANETSSSRPSSPGARARVRSMSGMSAASSVNAQTRGTSRSREGGGQARAESGFAAGTMAEGYFKNFFREEYRLGMGANGSVYLCQVSMRNIRSNAYFY